MRSTYRPCAWFWQGLDCFRTFKEAKMRKRKTSQKVNNQNLVSTSSSPRVSLSACGASGFWGGIWAAAGGFCTTGGSCCSDWFPWSCWTGSTSGRGNWTSGVMNLRGACIRKKTFPSPLLRWKKLSKECSTPIWYL